MLPAMIYSRGIQWAEERTFTLTIYQDGRQEHCTARQYRVQRDRRKSRGTSSCVRCIVYLSRLMISLTHSMA